MLTEGAFETAADVAITGCTVAFPHQIAHARVLSASFKKCHLGADFRVLLLKWPEDRDTQPNDVDFLDLAQAGLSAGEVGRLAMLRGAAEIALLAKLSLISTLLATNSVVVYFDPETQIFAPLTRLCVLAKHTAVTTMRPTQWPDGTVESSLAFHSPAFLAVGARSSAFVQTWIDSVRNAVGLDAPPADGNLTSRSEFYYLEDPAWDVGFWNLDSRDFRWESDRYLADGQPLHSFAFPGFDASKPYLLSRHQGDRPEIKLSQNPALAKLCAEYGRELIDAGYHAPSRQGNDAFRFLPSGLFIDKLMRSLYLQALERHRNGSGPEPPSPFGPGGERAFLRWVNEPLPTGGARVTRYMAAIHASRPDLQGTFPEPLGKDAAGFGQWFAAFGADEMSTPHILIPPELAVVKTSAALGNSVNVAGYLEAELGLGEAARLLVTTLDAAGIATNTFSYDATQNRQSHPFEHRRSAGTAADTNIICVNANELPKFCAEMGPDFFNGRYSIGVWFWEVDEFPESALGAFNYVDEVWVASEFMRAALVRVAPKPVFKFQLPILTPEIDTTLSRTDFGLPDRFVFLFTFDFLSVLDRKNPLGLISAFARAFRPGEGPVLVLKTINGGERIVEMERLKHAMRDHPDILLVDGYRSAVEKNTLTALCDCYISLHRSEGFGLTMAEAMALEKPVIATGYSGNLDFMTPQNSYLCGYSEQPVGPGRDPYPANAFWAEPDLDEAAALMRHVFENRDEANARGIRAAAELREGHSPQHCARAIQQRIATIRARRSRGENPHLLAIFEDRLQGLEASQREILKAIRTISGDAERR